jgi:hypothetical protein
MDITAAPRCLTARCLSDLQVEEPAARRLPMMVRILQLKIDLLLRMEYERREPFTGQDYQDEILNRYPF